MKEVWAIDPKNKILSIWPISFKKFLIKKKYKLLPENKFIRKIIAYSYTKLFRKFLILLGLLINVRFFLSNPKKFNYIIFDNFSLGTIDKILPPNSFFVLPTRIENFKKIYISKEIILYICKNFFKRSLKLNYMFALISLINPKKIITIIDNSKDFSLTYNQFKKKITFYAIQNAYRSKKYIKQIIYNSNYKGNYYSFSEYEIEELKKNYPLFNINLKSIGSLRIELAKESIMKNKKGFDKTIYDICLISEANYHVGSAENEFTPRDLFYEHYDYMIMLARYVLLFCKKHNKRFIFLGKENIDGELKEAEIFFYKDRIKDFNFDINHFDKSKFENIKHLLQSEVVVGTCSTLLRESFGLNKKILVCDWHAKQNDHGIYETNFPGNGILKIEGSNYADFEKKMIELLEISHDDYLSKIQNKDQIYQKNFETLDFLRNEMLN